jgi:hypothetical protein
MILMLAHMVKMVRWKTIKMMETVRILKLQDRTKTENLRSKWLEVMKDDQVVVDHINLVKYKDSAIIQKEYDQIEA